MRTTAMTRTRAKALLLALAMAVTMMFSYLGNAATTRFTDVPDSHWAVKEITWAVEKGIMNGTSATTFNPGGQTLRGQMTAILYRYAGSPFMDGTIPYTDVPSSSYYANASLWAQRNKILVSTKLNASKLTPNEAIGRAEFCTMVYNFAKYSGVDVTKTGSVPFTDTASLSSEYQTAIAWAYNNGIVNGTTATTFNPNGTLTRAAATAMLYRYENMGSDSGNTGSATKPQGSEQDVTQTGNTPSSVTLSKGANISITIPAGKSIPLVDELGGIWTCKQDPNGMEVATITYDYGLKKQVLLGMSEGTTTMTILSSADYETVLMTIHLTVKGPSGNTGSSGNSGSSTSGEWSYDSVDFNANMDIRDEIVRLTNEVRKENGVAELPTDSAMMNAAQAAADYYANGTDGIFRGHSDMEAQCVKYAGITYGFMPNLARIHRTSVSGAGLSYDTVELWKNSQGHFNTMVDVYNDNIGVGVAKDSNGYYWCVQFFGGYNSV